MKYQKIELIQNEALLIWFTWLVVNKAYLCQRFFNLDFNTYSKLHFKHNIYLYILESSIWGRKDHKSELSSPLNNLKLTPIVNRQAHIEADG